MGIRVSSRKTPLPAKLFVLSLEGVSLDFLKRHTGDGLLPNLGRLLAEGDLREMETALPPVSLVTWTSYMTGVNPGRHGVYGFVDRRPGSYDLFKLNGANIHPSTLWEVLGRAGRRVLVVNVPATYPPRPVNGVLVSCFLGPSVEKSVYPPSLAPRLVSINYRLDVGQDLETTDRDAMLADIDLAVRKRFEAAVTLLRQEEWDFSQLHVMETDRINHLLWGDYEDADAPYREAFLSFYRTLDDLIGEIVARLPGGCGVIVLSNHGFCRLRREVNLNRYLEELDWLGLKKKKPRRLSDMTRESKAYSLPPGRIYMNLRGREPYGSVLDRDEYFGYRKGLAADLLRLRDPETDGEVIDDVLQGEEVCSNPEWGGFPVATSERAPAPFDLLALPKEGYDLKGHLDRPSVFSTGPLSGMHTSRGAFVFLKGLKIRSSGAHILDLFPTILELMDVKETERLDGRSLLAEERE
jgi:predicted AlkP superfamily phosphohydrolase/phosphomutase